jgi:hypothetical protein
VQPVFGFVPDDGLRAVDDACGDLVAAVGRKAVKHDGVFRSLCHGRLVDGVLAEKLQPRLLFGFLAHGYPGVCCDDVGTLQRCGGIRGDEHRTAGLGGALLGFGHHVICREVPFGPGDADVHAGRDPGEQVGVGHVVGSIPQVAHSEALEFALVFLDGQQVREQLAGVVVIAQGVDDRHPGVFRHRHQAGMRAGPPDDG